MKRVTGVTHTYHSQSALSGLEGVAWRSPLDESRSGVELMPGKAKRSNERRPVYCSGPPVPCSGSTSSLLGATSPLLGATSLLLGTPGAVQSPPLGSVHRPRSDANERPRKKTTVFNPKTQKREKTRKTQFLVKFSDFSEIR